MNSNLFFNLVCLVAAVILAISGCDSADNRRKISQQAENLADKVKADPDSNEGKAAMKELIDILNGYWSFAQCKAADALGELGPLARPAYLT